MEYMAWLESQPLAVRTREAYAAVIAAFAGWLDGHGAWRAVRGLRSRRMCFGIRS